MDEFRRTTSWDIALDISIYSDYIFIYVSGEDEFVEDEDEVASDEDEDSDEEEEIEWDYKMLPKSRQCSSYT